MLLKTIRILIDRVLQKEPIYTRLEHLEKDVLSRIHSHQLTQSRYSFLPTLLNPQQFRYSSLVLFMVSAFWLSQISLQSSFPKYTLGLEIFSSQSSLLLTLITNKKDDIL